MRSAGLRVHSQYRILSTPKKGHLFGAAEERLVIRVLVMLHEVLTVQKLPIVEELWIVLHHHMTQEPHLVQ